MSDKSTCGKCDDGWVICDACKGTRKGLCQKCSGYRCWPCDCDKGADKILVSGGYNTVSGLFGDWDTEENRKKMAEMYQEAAKEAEPVAKATTWTTEYPTKPGFYWIRNYRIEGWHGSAPGPDIVHVSHNLTFDRIGDDEGYYEREMIFAEWYGPIEAPE